MTVRSVVEQLLLCQCVYEYKSNHDLITVTGEPANGAMASRVCIDMN